MEDGFLLLREWLFPHIESLPPAAEMASPDPRSLVHALRQVLLAAVMAGARDLDFRIFPDPVTGRFTVLEISHTADGPDFTQLKSLLDAGGFAADPLDWTRGEAALPLGPAGCVLTQWRMHSPGATLEAWLLPDGTAEIHVVEDAFGQQIRWFLPSIGARDLKQALPDAALRSGLRFRIDGEPFSWSPDPPGVVKSIRLQRPWGECVLCQLDRPDGEIRLFHRGFEIQRQPCPIPFLHFDWNSRFRPDVGSAGEAVTRDFLEARYRMEAAENRNPDLKESKNPGFPKGFQNENSVGSAADLLEPKGPFMNLQRIWDSMRRTDPRLKRASLHLVFLQPVFPEQWPIFSLPPNESGSESGFPAPVRAHRAALLPDFPETLLPVLGRLPCPQPGKSVPAEFTDLGIAINHPFVRHVFSKMRPAEALYLLLRIFLLNCNIEPDKISFNI